MKRHAHVLKTNASCETPVNITFFDVETDQIKSKDREVIQRFKLGWACHVKRDKFRRTLGKSWYEIKHDREFWAWLDGRVQKQTRMYLISHNIVFDFTVLKGFRHLIELGWEVKSFFSQSKTTIMKLRKGKRTIMILDNLNFFKLSLEKLGQEIGLDKGSIDFRTATRRELSAYCKIDVEILIETWRKYLNYIEDHDLGNFSVTTPAQAFNSYRHRFMHQEIFIHNSRRAIMLERESYSGGRVECFRIGKVPDKRVYALDINSMYPYVMSKFQYPVKLLKTHYRCTPSEIGRYLNRKLIVARVDIETKIPIVPIKRDGKLIFPIGRFQAVLTTPEIEFVLKHGKILKFRDVCVYQKADLFSDFVAYFHNLKTDATQEGRSSERLFAKLMMNSLYGKFGQSASSWKSIGTANIDKVEVQEVFSGDGLTRWLWYTFAGQVWEIERGGESFNSFPAIAAHVTAYARRYLYELILKAGRRHVYYCDTDSLFVSEKGLSRLQTRIKENVLGALNLESVIDDLTIYCPKDYIADGNPKRKGIRRDAVELSPGTFEQDQWLTFRGLMHRGNLDEYVVRPTIKRVKRIYDKGVVQSDGRVKPHLLEC